MYHFLYVGVSSLGEASLLWSDLMGFRPFGLPPDYARSLEILWGLEANAIAGLLGLETPDAPGGRLVFVEFSVSAKSVRELAAPTDLCPKNLDINVIDLPQRVAELRAAGYILRSEPVEYKLGELDVREVQLPVHDDVNLVLAEIIGEPLQSTSRGYGGVTSVVTTVNEIAAEKSFFMLLGFHLLDAHSLSGPEVEQMVGLARGGILNMQLLGCENHRFGRAELVSYSSACGVNRYPLAVPPARGLMRAAMMVSEIILIRERLLQAGFECGNLQPLIQFNGV